MDIAGLVESRIFEFLYTRKVLDPFFFTLNTLLVFLPSITYDRANYPQLSTTFTPTFPRTLLYFFLSPNKNFNGVEKKKNPDPRAFSILVKCIYKEKRGIVKFDIPESILPPSQLSKKKILITY